MQPDFNNQYCSLVADFRAFKEGACINADNTMNDAAFYSNWPSPGGGLDPGTTGTGSSSGNGSWSNMLTPKSSDLSDSPPEEPEMRHGELVIQSRTSSSKLFLPSDSRKGNGILDSRKDQTAEPDDILEDGLPSHRPRKGHKKSRGGCYNCKRRKIKVGLIRALDIL